MALLDILRLRSLVEFNMRLFKIHGSEQKSTDQNIPPEENVKDPDKLESWGVNKTLAVDQNNKIVLNIAADNNTNMRDMIAQCIYDALTDVIVSSDPLKLSVSGQKFVDKDNNQTVTGNVYGGGDKTPGPGNGMIEIPIDKSFSLKSGNIILKIDSTGLFVSYDNGANFFPISNASYLKPHTHPYKDASPLTEQDRVTGMPI